MRFKEFLFERQISSLDSVIQQIRTNCQPFLKQGRMLYRGFSPYLVKNDKAEKFDATSAFYSPHPDERKPRDSHRSPYFNFMFNAGCDLAFGEPNIRTHSIFATNTIAQAKIFGEVTFFFPAGEFRFISSTVISDSFEESIKLRSNIAAGVGYSAARIGKIREGFDVLADKYKDKTHDWITDAEKALKPTMEAFNETDEQFYFKLKDATKDCFNTFYDDTPTLSHYRLPANGGELIFYQTHGYYSVPAKMIMKEMSDKGVEHAGIEEDDEIKKYLRSRIDGQGDAI